MNKATRIINTWADLKVSLQKAIQSPSQGFFTVLRTTSDLLPIQMAANKEFEDGSITKREALDKWSEALFRYNASQTYREKVRGKRGI